MTLTELLPYDTAPLNKAKGRKQSEVFSLDSSDLLMEGFADAGQKPPALDRPPRLPSEANMRAKGSSEGQLILEALN